MRIVHVIQWLTTLGGGPTSVLASLARIQAAAGHQVKVVAGMQSPYPHALNGEEDSNIVVRPGATQGHLWWYDHAAHIEICEQIRGYDIVHIHSTWRYHFLAAAGAATSYGIPFVVSPHGNLDRYSLNYRRWMKWPYFLMFERRRMNRAAAIHCCSQMEMREVSRLPIWARKFVIPNPVASELLHDEPDNEELARQIPHLRSDQKIISFLGRFHPIKRLDVAVAAFRNVAAKHPNWVLVLAGPHEDVELTHRLEAEVKAAGLCARVFMPGMISGQAKAALLRRTAIYVQPSIHENFCVSVAEAMRFAVPCIVSEEVALADEIKSAEAGIVCQGTSEAFSRILDELMSNSNLRQRFGENGAKAAAQFNPEEIERRFTTEYERCINES